MQYLATANYAQKIAGDFEKVFILTVALFAPIWIYSCEIKEKIALLGRLCHEKYRMDAQNFNAQSARMLTGR